MNYPNATASDWTHAQAIIRRHLTAHGIAASDADDIAQAWATKALTQAHALRCPRTPAHAARGYVRLCRRHGLAYLPTGAERRRKARREGAEPIPVYATTGRPTPDAIVSAVERAAGPVIPSPYATRRRATIEAIVRESVTGIGTEDPADAARYASTATTYGSRYTPPQTGCRGFHTDTDPNPASRERAWLECAAAAERVGLTISSRHRQ